MLCSQLTYRDWMHPDSFVQLTGVSRESISILNEGVKDGLVSYYYFQDIRIKWQEMVSKCADFYYDMKEQLGNQHKLATLMASTSTTYTNTGSWTVFFDKVLFYPVSHYSIINTNVPLMLLEMSRIVDDIG